MMKSNISLFYVMLNHAEEALRLNKLLGDVVISQGGVVPHIAAVSRYIIGLVHSVPTHSFRNSYPPNLASPRKMPTMHDLFYILSLYVFFCTILYWYFTLAVSFVANLYPLLYDENVHLT